MAEQSWGLLALARSGDVELSIDESTNEPKAYVMTISVPRVEFRFAIRNLEVASELSRFLLDHCNRTVSVIPFLVEP